VFHALVANDDAVLANADTPVNIPVSTLLANDSGWGASQANIWVHDQPAHGTLTPTPGWLTYTPALGYSGPDTFTYRVVSDGATSHLATVRITVHEAADLALTSFTSDGSKLWLNYLVLGSSIAPFNIAVYTSPDGTTLGQQIYLRSGDTSPGYHALGVSPSFIDPTEDFYLIARLDSGGTVEETNESNNQMRLGAGAFLNKRPGTCCPRTRNARRTNSPARWALATCWPPCASAYVRAAMALPNN